MSLLTHIRLNVHLSLYRSCRHDNIVFIQIDSTINIWSANGFTKKKDTPKDLDATEVIDGNTSSNNIEDSSGVLENLLCTISAHQGEITKVRWSRNGRYLASSGIDNLVMIYYFDTNNSQSTPMLLSGLTVSKSSSHFGPISQGIEDWKQVLVLRGHKYDVLDISWSPEDNYLASCGIDNLIYIWQIEPATDPQTSKKIYSKLMNLPPVKVLQENDGWILSLCWDPVGLYFASATPNSVRVWRRSDWKEDANITDTLSKNVERKQMITWSPDGKQLAIANAIDTFKFVAVLAERAKWQNSSMFIRLAGHSQLINLACFSPVLYKRYLENDASQKLKKQKLPGISGNSKYDQNIEVLSVLATCSTDGVFVLWSTGTSEPIEVISLEDKAPFSDITWSGDGSRVFLSSPKGIECIQLKLNEVGTPLTELEMNALLRMTYGTVKINTEDQVAETPYHLRMEREGERLREEAATHLTSINYKSSSSLSSLEKKPTLTNKQVETVTASGKRRIQPMQLSSGNSITVVSKNPSFANAGSPKLLQPTQSSKPKDSETNNVITAVEKLVAEFSGSSSYKKAFKSFGKKEEKPAIVVATAADKSNNTTSILSVGKKSAATTLPAKPPPLVFTKLHAQTNIQSDMPIPGVDDSGSTLSLSYKPEVDQTFISLNRLNSNIKKRDRMCNWTIPGAITKIAFGRDGYIAISSSRDEIHIFNSQNESAPLLPIACDGPIADVLILSSVPHDKANSNCLLAVITCAGNFSVWNIDPFEALLTQISILPIIRRLNVPISLSSTHNQSCSFHLSPIGTLAAIVAIAHQDDSESECSMYIFDKEAMCWNKIIDSKTFRGLPHLISGLDPAKILNNEDQKHFYIDIVVSFYYFLFSFDHERANFIE